MKQYTSNDLLPVARQIYGEMKYLMLPPSLIRQYITDALGEWDVTADVDFIANFPGQDPDLARHAFRYLLENFEQISEENPKVEIRREDLRRFDFSS